MIALAFGWKPEDPMLLIGFALATVAFPVNPELTVIAIAFQNPAVQLIADSVFPRIPTPKKFAYSTYTVAQGYTVPDTKIGRKSEPNMVDFGGVLVNAECVDWGLDDLVPNDEIAAWEAMPKPATGGPINPIALSTMLLTGLVQLDREIRVAGIVFNTANYSGANQSTLSGTSKWSDQVNSNPLNAIAAALDIPLVRPNTLVLGQQTWTQLRQHPKIVQAIYNTAKKGQAPVYSRAWCKHASLLNIDGLAAQLGQPTYGWTAQSGTRIAGEIPEPKKGLRGGTTVRSGESVMEVIASTDAGYFFQNAVA